ncbi:MAG: transporter [Marivirga sp.]|nr:transporter [Marivirga sp.]
MKILFFTSPTEDYLADSVLHGLRVLYGKDCVDYPKCEILYKDCPEYIINQVRGNGFTLYSGLLDDIPIDRFNIEDKIAKGYFDLIIISDIQRHFGWFVQYRPYLTPKNCIVLDGSDTTQPYPAHGRWWRRPYYWFLPKAHPYYLYFKREWVPDTHFSVLARAIPKGIRSKFPKPKTLRCISFSIPAEKIVDHIPNKKKDFPKHIVDPEIASKVADSHTSYAFTSEREYYKDLQESRFGITTKRAGWDCLRHYEIAANGAVLCFRDYELKPETCAPHGLNKQNSIFYKNAEDLMKRISNMTQEEYQNLQKGTLEWVKTCTTVEVGKKLISEVNALSSDN